MKRDTKRTIDHLKKARQLGFRNYEWLKQNKNFDFIRENEEFKDLMKEEKNRKS